MCAEGAFQLAKHKTDVNDVPVLAIGKQGFSVEFVAAVCSYHDAS